MKLNKLCWLLYFVKKGTNSIGYTDRDLNLTVIFQQYLCAIRGSVHVYQSQLSSIFTQSYV